MGLGISSGHPLLSGITIGSAISTGGLISGETSPVVLAVLAAARSYRTELSMVSILSSGF